MSMIQKIENYINGELQLIADDLKEEIIDIQYEDYMEEMYLRYEQYDYDAAYDYEENF